MSAKSIVFMQYTIREVQVPGLPKEDDRALPDTRFLKKGATPAEAPSPLHGLDAPL